MKDRVPLYPGRVKLTPVAGQENTYDMVRADQPTEVGTPLNKDSLLKDATAALFGLGVDAVPDEVFKVAHDRYTEIRDKVGDIKLSKRNLESLTGKYLLCDGRSVKVDEYKELFDVLGYGEGLYRRLVSSKTAGSFPITSDKRSTAVWISDSDLKYYGLYQNDAIKAMSITRKNRYPSSAASQNKYVFLEGDEGSRYVRIHVFNADTLAIEQDFSTNLLDTIDSDTTIEIKSAIEYNGELYISVDGEDKNLKNVFAIYKINNNSAVKVVLLTSSSSYGFHNAIGDYIIAEGVYFDFKNNTHKFYYNFSSIRNLFPAIPSDAYDIISRSWRTGMYGAVTVRGPTHNDIRGYLYNNGKSFLDYKVTSYSNKGGVQNFSQAYDNVLMIGETTVFLLNTDSGVSTPSLTMNLEARGKYAFSGDKIEDLGSTFKIPAIDSGFIRSKE